MRCLFVLCLALMASLAASIPIEDCCCDATTVDIANDETLHDKLETLRQTTFFKIFRVNLMSDCPFWREDGMCTRRSCSVWECEDHEVPVVFKKELEADAGFSSSSTLHPHSDEADELPISRVDFSVSSDLVKWTENDENTWIIQHAGDKMSFVDLTRNLESYTGFEGVDAHKMWRAIYKENCFHGGTDNMCFEERVFFRLISGLHSSISAHTADKFPVNQLKRRVTVVGNTEFEEFYVEPVGEMAAVDGASIQVFNQKLGYFPDRINNLYFVFVFLLRAVNKASEILRYYDYNTGNATEDQLTRRLVLTLLDSTMVKDCDTSHSFDESSMFNSPDKLPLLRQFRNKFRNISQIIDCVGCEKCRLHGKLQVLGIGTALKILFAGKSGQKLKPGELELNRNEVLALINTVGKFSHSIQIVHSMRKIEFKHKVVYYGMIAVFCAGLLLIGVTALRWMRRRGKAKAKSS